MSSSRVLFAFTLRGLPELAARGFLVYFENRVSAERDRSRGESERFHLRGVQPVHAHSGGRNTESTATSNGTDFALLDCSFQQASAVSPVVYRRVCSSPTASH